MRALGGGEVCSSGGGGVGVLGIWMFSRGTGYGPSHMYPAWLACHVLRVLRCKDGMCVRAPVQEGDVQYFNTKPHTGCLSAKVGASCSVCQETIFTPCLSACVLWLQGSKLTAVINSTHENPKYLPGIALGSNVIADAELESTVSSSAVCSATLLCTPSLWSWVRPHFGRSKLRT